MDSSLFFFSSLAVHSVVWAVSGVFCLHAVWRGEGTGCGGLDVRALLGKEA